MNRYTSYQIRQCAVVGGSVTPIKSGPATIDNLAVKTFWTLYAFTWAGRHQAIGDFDSYEHVRAAYFGITGNDCGPEPKDHYQLPAIKAVTPADDVVFEDNGVANVWRVRVDGDWFAIVQLHGAMLDATQRAVMSSFCDAIRTLVDETRSQSA